MNKDPKRLSVPGYRIRKILPKGEGKLVEVSCDPLSGGFPSSGSERTTLRLYPGGKSVRVDLVREEEGRRVAALKGVARSTLPEGAVLIPADWPVVEDRDALFLHDGGTVPAEPEAVRGGLDPLFNADRFVGRARFRVEGAFISARFPQPFPLLPGAEYTFLDGEGTTRSLTLLWPGRPDAEARRRLDRSAFRRPNPHPGTAEVYGRILHAQGFARIPSVLAEAGWEGASLFDGWVVLDDRRAVFEKKVRKLASRPGGADKRALRLPGCPDGFVASLAASMRDSGELQERNGWFFPPGDPPLSPFHRGWLGKIEAAGAEGIRVRGAVSPADRDAVDALVRSGLVFGGGDLWLSREAYEQAAAEILGDDVSGTRISMADARARLGGPRAVTLEVLALMERDGRLLRADGDEERIVP